MSWGPCVKITSGRTRRMTRMNSWKVALSLVRAMSSAPMQIRSVVPMIWSAFAISCARICTISSFHSGLG